VAGRAITAFVAMSFREEEEPALVDYYAAINRAAKNSGLPIKVTRMDLEAGDYEISQGIMDKIDEADIIVADFTLSSRNVYFEVGYARGQQKRVIQTARKETVLEFDVHHWRTLFYRNATELEARLLPELAAAYQEVTAP
jgi:nucleoside 2-deoxyribosyltransferase